MKVLFAVSSESISDAIIKRYQKEYKEILSYKNVYYFNAILKEIQKDKSYDRIVISEDLEPFSNNNYDTIDKFIFEKLDNISDEAHDSQGKETSIILICTDRHTKGSSFLVKLFGIGVYNALLGNDRSMDQVCKLINQPRVKKEAKSYYKIDAEDVSYDPSSEKEVSELEIQNILTHFKKISKNKEKYADSFNNIAAQYTDDQLKIIINCLPISVKAVLEEECPKYQELMSASMIQRVGGKARLQAKDETEKTGIKIDILESKLSQPKMSGPIVIPSSVKTAGKKGPVKVKQVESLENTVEQPVEKKVVKKINNNSSVKQKVSDEEDFLLDMDEVEDTKLETPVPNKNSNQKPKKVIEEDEDFLMPFDDEQEDDLLMSFEDDNDDLSMTLDEDDNDDLSMTLNEDDNDDLLMTLDEDDNDELLMTLDDESEDDLLSNFDEEDELDSIEEEQPVINENRTIKRGRGRPRKNPVEVEPKPKGRRGRPRKNPLPIEDEFEDNDDLSMPLDDEQEDDLLMSFDEEDDLLLDSSNEKDDDLLEISLEDEEDHLEIELDDGQEDDDLLMSFDDEGDDDSLLLSSDEEDNDEDDTISMSFDEEAETEEVSLPEIDDLDDIEDYEEDEDISEMLPGMEYEEIDEEDYLVTENSNQEDDETTSMSLDEDEFDSFNNNEDIDEDDDDSLLMMSNNGFEDSNDAISSGVTDFSDNLDSIDNFEEEPILNQSYNNYRNTQTNNVESIKPQVDYSMSALNSLLTKDKKIVTFIGTTKNGTSFLINNLAALFASLGINTAILDMTQNRNSYYIYTKNEEELRKIAYTSIEKLENGFAEGIKVDKNLTVYTALPNNGKKYTNAEPILSTLVQNHSLILIDCDFDTDPSYFASCQEIYLVQSMDILTIQPLTSFLRDLKAKGVLESEKVRVVINKEMKVRSLTTKIIIGGMSFYNDPAMAFMTELFNKDMVKACSIPFEDATYSKYLDAMVNCNVSLNGYSKAFLSKLRILGDMVYPLTSKQTYSKSVPSYNKSAFSNSTNNTLNQMKNKF